ncbi:MAG TPA: CpsD/CapB family tyrosine-protein kinase [Planctomycetota bacterium]|nr:CpsD/CapB family tyrosine-protein kinase [Planctomycetota bacterium]
MKPLLGRRDTKGRKAEVMTTELGYLWSNLLQRGCGESIRSLGFCAIGDDEGSNTIAANMALFLGSKGKRVALVEATLREPVMSAIFKATESPGLADYLLGKASLRDVRRAQVAPGVDLVPAGESIDPYWGFTGDRFRTLLKEFLVEADLCLVDVPGLNRAPEASLVVRSVDAVVLVVEANRHRAEVVKRNIAYLRSLGTPFLGVLMNELVHEIPNFIAKLM